MRLRVSLLAAAVCLAAHSLAFGAGYEQVFNQAVQAYQSGDFDKSGKLFNEAGDLAVKSSPQQAGKIWGNAAVASIKAENYEAAAEIYEKILALKGIAAEDQLKFAKNMFFCRQQLGQSALLAAGVQEFLQNHKKLSAADLSELNATLGDAYRSLELYGMAVDAYSAALKSVGKDSEKRALILTARGLCAGNLGRYDAAIADLQEALKLAGSSKQVQTIVDTNSNLGILSWEKGDYQAALKNLNTALKTEQDNELTRNLGVDKNNLALVYKSMGNHAAAMDLVQESLKLAQQVKNTRDEGIATVNRALLYRIAGNFEEAARDYSRAMQLFEQCGFQEGIAGAHLGIGRMISLQSADYQGALQHYAKALEIYEDLGLVRSQAETLVQTALIYKYMSAPKATATRDLVFVDEESEEPAPAMPADKALTASRAAGEKALKLAEDLGSRELIWSAHQIIGYADYKEGNLESAYDHYQQAIDIVTAQNLSIGDVETFGEYLADKEDLYAEAQAVCGALYDKTKDGQYLDQLLKYGETLKNEIQKASAALAQLNFADPKKQELFDKLNSLAKQKAAAEKSLPPALQKLADNAAPEEAAKVELVKTERERQSQEIEKLSGEYDQILAQWQQQYPGDAVLFQSASRVDIPMVQQNIRPEDAVLLYTSLPERLLITVITKDKTSCTSVEVGQDDINKLIRDDYLISYIEPFGHNHSDMSTVQKQQIFGDVCKMMQTAYGWLIKPIEAEISNAKRLYVVSDGFLAQTPFAALVSGFDADGNPDFLVEKYDIGYLRPSFIDTLKRPAASGRVKRLLAVANAVNPNFTMDLLEGTISEVAQAERVLPGDAGQKDLALEMKIEGSSDIMAQMKIKQKFDGALNSTPPEPTEVWWREKLASNQYEMLYFATHGMPYSNVVSSLAPFIKKYQDREKDVMARLAENPNDPSIKNKVTWRRKAMMDRNLAGKSPLNGFLYLSSLPEDDILKGAIPKERDGLLTMQEILELPESEFEGTNYVILSACNSGVSYAPSALAEGLDQDASFTSDDAKRLLNSQGFLPGVDQVSFVDVFMRRGVSNVFGNLWFVDDGMSSELLSRFMKILTAQGDQPDAVAAYNQAQRSLLSEAKQGKEIIDRVQYPVPMHPFFWAAGAMFGK